MTKCIADWCQSFEACEVIESPCAVCARLAIEKDLVAVDSDEIDLSRLQRSGVTRLERRSSFDSVEEETGPVLYKPGCQVVAGKNLLSICSPCLRSLRQNRLPRCALTNDL